MTQEYPWYEIVPETEGLEQGDFIDNCEVFIPSYTSHNVATMVSADTQEIYAKGVLRTYDVVVISQSCTLENRGPDDDNYVLVCPRRAYSEYVNTYLAKDQGAKTREQIMKAIHANLEQIRLGRSYQYCLLNECKGLDLTCEMQVVDLGTVFSISYDVIQLMAQSRDQRLHLLSPYVEHLAQAFAYYYMRVALPTPIPSFTKPKVKEQVSIKPD